MTWVEQLPSVLEVPCPSCRVPANRVCVNCAGRPREPHFERRAAAAQASDGTVGVESVPLKGDGPELKGRA